MTVAIGDIASNMELSTTSRNLIATLHNAESASPAAVTGLITSLFTDLRSVKEEDSMCDLMRNLKSITVGANSSFNRHVGPEQWPIVMEFLDSLYVFGDATSSKARLETTITRLATLIGSLPTKTLNWLLAQKTVSKTGNAVPTIRKLVGVVTVSSDLSDDIRAVCFDTAQHYYDLWYGASDEDSDSEADSEEDSNRLEHVDAEQYEIVRDFFDNLQIVGNETASKVQVENARARIKNINTLSSSLQWLSSMKVISTVNHGVKTIGDLVKVITTESSDLPDDVRTVCRDTGSHYYDIWCKVPDEDKED